MGVGVKQGERDMAIAYHGGAPRVRRRKNYGSEKLPFMPVPSMSAITSLVYSGIISPVAGEFGQMIAEAGV